MSRSGNQSDNWDEFRSSDEEEHSSSDDEDIDNKNADENTYPENSMLDETWQEALEIASSVADSCESESGGSTKSDGSEEEDDSQPKRKKKKYSRSNVSSQDEYEDINYSESTDDFFTFLRGVFMVRMSTPAPGVSELHFNETLVRTYNIPIICNGTEVTFEIGRQSNINWNPESDVLKIEVIDKADPKREVRWIEISFSPEVKHRRKEIKTLFEGNVLKVTFPQLVDETN